jgi:hypothetical protein
VLVVFLHCYNDVPNPLEGVVRLDDAHELICLPFICNSDQAKGNGGTLTNWALKAYNGLLLQQLFFILRLLSIFLSASLLKSLYQSFHRRLFLYGHVIGILLSIFLLRRVFIVGFSFAVRIRRPRLLRQVPASHPRITALLER